MMEADIQVMHDDKKQMVLTARFHPSDLYSLPPEVSAPFKNIVSVKRKASEYLKIFVDCALSWEKIEEEKKLPRVRIIIQVGDNEHIPATLHHSVAAAFLCGEKINITIGGYDGKYIPCFIAKEADQ
jgi:hypothetical protein